VPVSGPSELNDAPSAPTPAPARTKRRGHGRAVALFVVPTIVAVVLILLLQGSLTLLDPQAGVWASTRTASWGNQTVTLTGLEQPVTIVRDGNGTTHIFAMDDPDLFFAQGYTQAADRLFQMEAESLSAQGNLSSWEGSAGLASDEMYRYLGVPQAAAEMASQIGSVNPLVAQDMTAYVEGVNAYISWAESHNAVPFQFKVLGVSPYRWSLYASFCFDRLMVIGQTTGFTEPLYASVAAATTGDAAFNQLFPVYPQYWQNYTVLPGNGSIGGASLASQGISANYLFSLDWLGSWATGLSGKENGTLIPLERAALTNLSDPFIQDLSPSAGVGSNSWVVAANHSTLDQPMLANDPHLPLMLPSLWVSTQLVSPDYDVEGWSLAGLLGVLIGHDNQMAWALTNSEGATVLDYVETLQGDTYLENGTWHPLTWTNETIQVKGEGAVSFDLPWTSNGPVVARIGDLGLSVRWAGTGPTWEAAAELEFDRAQSILQFESALQQYWTIPNLNAMMIARNASDPTGHIGWIIPARYSLLEQTLPDGQHVQVIGSRGPLNGSGGYEPVGSVPFEELPQVEDPAQGYLFAPNQPTVGQEYPFPMIGSWWDSGGRAHTIRNFLASRPVMSPSLMMALQSNITDSWAIGLRPYLLQALQGVAAELCLGPPGTTCPEIPAAVAAIPIVEAWNGSFEVSSVAATVYTYWWNELQQATYDPVMVRADLVGANAPFPNAYAWIAANAANNSTWFPLGFFIQSKAAAGAALSFLSEKLGVGPNPEAPQLSGWTWRRVHTFFLNSLTGVASLGEGPYPQWGDSYTPSVAPFEDNITVPLVQVSIGSSLRFVSTAGTSPAWGVLPGGASENPASAYYDDLLPLWLAHEYVGMSSAADTPETMAQAVSVWTLQP
jgi:penicillin G amidase